METFIFAFLVIALMVGGMAVGVIFTGRPIKGSCGGMAALKMDTACEICGGDTAKCEEEQVKQATSKNTDLGYDASLKK